MQRSPSAGARIKAARLKKGWSQAEFAEKLAVSQPAVAHWESGAHAPRYALLHRIAALLEIPREDIAPKRKRKPAPLHLNLRTSQMLGSTAEEPLAYELSRLELSFGDQIERVAPIDSPDEAAHVRNRVMDGVAEHGLLFPGQRSDNIHRRR
jgi:transcriptional regulator with XRE-family HTH domain